jgi:hypothetical protein
MSRSDFRPTSERCDSDAVEPGHEYEEPIDQARDRGDFTDDRVAQPGDDPAGETVALLAACGLAGTAPQSPRHPNELRCAEVIASMTSHKLVR